MRSQLQSLGATRAQPNPSAGRRPTPKPQAPTAPRGGCSCGGLCPRCNDSKTSGLSVSKPGDHHEQAAKRFARQSRSESDAPAAAPPTTQHIAPSASHAARSELFNSGGRPLSTQTRAQFEPRLGMDLGHVRIHADADTARTARRLHADAFTHGSDIGFAARRYAPDSGDGRQLLAHELVHVAQFQQGGNGGTVYRAVSADYETIESDLSYGLFDWAITDAEARHVLVMLDRLSDLDLADTVAAMDRDGLADRLLDNITREDEDRFAVLIGRITRHRSTSHSADWIIERLSYGFFDWAITDDEAHRALTALMGLESQELRTVVGRMVNDGVFDRLEEQLPDEDIARFPAFLSRLREIRDEFNALVAQHLSFLRNRPEASSSPSGAGAAIRSTVTTTGYGGSVATWPDLSAAQQRDWQRRARVAIAAVIASVRGTELEPILARGKLVFEPAEAERLNAYAYVAGEDKLYFGRGWVQDAEINPRSVWQSIAHELGGHEEFGATWSWEIMQATLAGLTAQERREAFAGVHSVYSAFGYLETELYAELRELPHRTPESGGDVPATDVPRQLRRIRDAFGPDVGRQIVLRLYYRILGDPRISESARRLLYNAVQSVFGMFPYADAIAP